MVLVRTCSSLASSSVFSSDTAFSEADTSSVELTRATRLCLVRESVAVRGDNRKEGIFAAGTMEEEGQSGSEKREREERARVEHSEEIMALQQQREGEGDRRDCGVGKGRVASEFATHNLSFSNGDCNPDCGIRILCCNLL